MRKPTALFLAALLLALSAAPALGQSAAPVSQIRAGDVLCFGAPDDACGFDGKWLVLDAEHTSMGTEGLFLVSLSLIGDAQGQPVLFRDIGDVSVSFSNRGEEYAQAHPGATDYQGSALQQWCADFLAAHFSQAEQSALLPTFQSDDGIAVPGFSLPLPGAAAGTVDFSPAPGILRGDRLFPLSAAEAVNPAYGFADNRSRVALFKGAAAGYWLRSPHIPTFPLDVGFVFSFGAVMDYPVNARSMFSMETYARPACNLDSTRIASLEPLAESDGRTVWRVVFQGDAPGSRVYDPSLPDVGNVPDVQRIISISLIAVPALLLALAGLAVWLVVRRVRKKKAARSV